VNKDKKILWRKKLLGVIVLLVFSASLAGCSSQQANNTEKPQLVLGDVSWASIQVHNRIAGFIIEHGYGYPEPEYLFGETLPMLQGLGNGDIDILMEVWADNHREAWDQLVEAGQVKSLGHNFPDSAQGWYVPTYMIKGDAERGIEAVAPGLKSVKDLPLYKDLFKDPEVPGKGRFYNSSPGWVCTGINEQKFAVYGLNDYFNLFTTGSQTALVASIMAAYEKGEPWVGYYWEPEWVMGLLDMTLLEEPAYDEAIWNENKGCAYPPSTVLIGVNSDMEKKAPDIYEFLQKYETTTEQTNRVLAYMHEQGDDVEAAAIWFLREYPEVWRSWVTDEAAQKIAQALDEVK
jgi:glycine betaine/proline transport system substrate-binding protein